MNVMKQFFNYENRNTFYKFLIICEWNKINIRAMLCNKDKYLIRIINNINHLIYIYTNTYIYKQINRYYI